MGQVNWLLLRGLTRESRHWGDFPIVLGQKLTGDTVTCLDLPGFGTENKRNSPQEISVLVEDIRQRWLNFSRRDPTATPVLSAVIGMSLGGMIALQWMATFPMDFSAGVIINSSASGLSTPFERLRPHRILDILKTRLYRKTIDREKVILRMTTNLLGEVDSLAREWADFALKNPYSSLNAMRQLVAAIGFKAPDQISSPLLFLASDKDRFTDKSCSQNLAQKYSAPIFYHGSAGHDLTTDDPQWVVDKITEFKKKNKI